MDAGIVLKNGSSARISAFVLSPQTLQRVVLKLQLHRNHRTARNFPQALADGRANCHGREAADDIQHCKKQGEGHHQGLYPSYKAFDHQPQILHDFQSEDFDNPHLTNAEWTTGLKSARVRAAHAASLAAGCPPTKHKLIKPSG